MRHIGSRARQSSQRERPQRVRRGQAAVEFALAGTVLIAVLFGILEVGRLMFINAEVENSAREGAQYAALNIADPSLAANVRLRVLSKLSATNPSTVTVHGPCFPNDGDPNASCPNGSKCPFCRVQVGVTTVWKSFVSFVPDVQLVYTSTKMIESAP